MLKIKKSNEAYALQGSRIICPPQWGSSLSPQINGDLIHTLNLIHNGVQEISRKVIKIQKN